MTAADSQNRAGPPLPAPRPRLRAWLLALIAVGLLVLLARPPRSTPQAVSDACPITTRRRATAATAADAVPAAPADLLKATRGIQTQLEEMLGETFHEPVRVRVVGLSQCRDIFAAEIDHDTPPEEMRFVQDAFIRFGLFPRGFAFRQTFLDLVCQQVQGFYIPRQKTLYLIQGMPLQSVITAHELTHALQDQRAGLQGLMDSRKHSEDGILALQSVFEGEAVLSMGVHMARYGKKWEIISGTIQSSFLMEGQSESLRAVPLYLQRRLLFPYTVGKDFVLEALKRDHWRGVRNLYRDLPESSEQILHPDKYYGRRDRPTQFALPDLPAVLGAGWRLCGQDTLGEMGVQVLLETLNGKTIAAVQASRGWDGDRFALLTRRQDPTPRQALIWLSTWDSPGHAHRFAEAYAAALSTHLGQRADRSAAGKYGWTPTRKRAILLGRWDQEVLLLDGLASEEQVRVRAALSRSKRSGELFATDHRQDGTPQPVMNTDERGSHGAH